MTSSYLHPDRLFAVDQKLRQTAQEIYQALIDLPLIAQLDYVPDHLLSNQAFANFAEVLLPPQAEIIHYFYNQGYRLSHLEQALENRDADGVLSDWQTLVDQRHLFQGTVLDLNLKYIIYQVFQVELPLESAHAVAIAEQINQRLKQAPFLPQALMQSAKLESLTISAEANADLAFFSKAKGAALSVKCRPGFRPDVLLDPENPGFNSAIDTLAERSGEDTQTYLGYLKALANRREYFKSHGATTSEHHHPSAATVELTPYFATQLYLKARQNECSASEAEAFRAHMLFEMARMSLEDGLIMQLHTGIFRNYNGFFKPRFEFQAGADVPIQTEYSRSLWAILNAFGNEKQFKLVLYSENESAYSQELAPLAACYPALKIGAPSRFQKSPAGLRRFQHSVSANAGFYNTVNLPGNHASLAAIAAGGDLNRRADAAFLAEWVCQHRLTLSEAQQIAQDLAYHWPKQFFGL